MKGFIYCNSKVYPDDEYCALMTVYRDLLTAIKTMTVGDCIGVDELYFRDGAILALFLNECCAEGEITFIMRVNKGFLIQYTSQMLRQNHGFAKRLLLRASIGTNIGILYLLFSERFIKKQMNKLINL